MEVSNIRSYDFKNIGGADTTCLFDVALNNNADNILKQLNLEETIRLHKENKYKIIRYKKNMLTPEKYDTSGLFRSLIHKDGKIICYAPPKSMEHNSFKDNVDLANISVEEYVEGTMINMFWTGAEWEIATRSSVGGNVSFFRNTDKSNNKTFRQMFLEAIYHNEKNAEEKDFFTALEAVPRDICLTFVLQHPENRIVVPFSTPKIYLVKAYKLEDDHTIQEVTVTSALPSWVKYPEKLQYSSENIEQILNAGSVNEHYTFVGLMIYGNHSTTGKRVRTKIRNAKYEYVRELRGNQPKLQYRYLMLRNEKKVSEYLSFFPEHNTFFTYYQKQIDVFTYTLYKHYVSCYIYKQKPLGLYSPQYRTHMYKLHELYIMDRNMAIKLNRVVDYINHLHPTLLMHSINYKSK